MRNSFLNAITECARQDERVALLMAEVGFSVVEPFEKEFPNRFYNTGIAEQNLVATSAGMAVAGMRPIAYSMSSFLATRAFEQIKVSVCYQNVPVILISTGSGLSYGEMGSTHHAIEESDILRSLPNLKVAFPSDGYELSETIKYALSQASPFFISFPKMPDPKLPEHEFSFGHLTTFTEGDKAVIFAVGTAVSDAINAADILKTAGIDIAVRGINCVKPLNANDIVAAAASGNVFVVDEHVKCGSVGSDIARILLENNVKINIFKEISIPDTFVDSVGKYAELKKLYGLDGDSIAETVRNSLKK